MSARLLVRCCLLSAGRPLRSVRRRRRPPASTANGAAGATAARATRRSTIVITIENGFVDGSAYDTTAHGPVPNLKKAPPPAPTPGLWQIHGLAKPAAPFR